MKKTLLAVAAAGLLAGSAAAWAQGMPDTGNSAHPDQTQHPAARPDEGNIGPGAIRPDAGQQGGRPDNDQNRQIQRTQLQGSPDRDQMQGSDRDRLQGGQMLRGGDVRNAASHPLTVEERTNLRETVLRSGPRVTHVNFRIGVGAVVPRNIRIVAVPQPIVAIYPEWAGDLYFDYGDEIVVVAPGTMQIVGVLPL
ncbi:MAG TPA: DUF1236 domain-containing protein [Rhizomicrobium sp.]